jgi:hypothetical protein
MLSQVWRQLPGLLIVSFASTLIQVTVGVFVDTLFIDVTPRAPTYVLAMDVLQVSLAYNLLRWSLMFESLLAGWPLNHFSRYSEQTLLCFCFYSGWTKPCVDHDAWDSLFTKYSIMFIDCQETSVSTCQAYQRYATQQVWYKCLRAVVVLFKRSIHWSRYKLG